MAEQLVVTPNPALVGSNILITGSGFDPKRKVQLALDGSGWTTNYFRPAKDGTFKVGMNVSTSPKTQTVTARYAGTKTVVTSTTVTVVASLPAPEPEPTPEPEGAPTQDLPNFKHIFADNFTTLDTSHYWSYPSTWGDTRYKQGDKTNGGLYTGFAAMQVANSILTVKLARDANNQPRSVAFVPYVSGTEDDQLYGRYAIRFRSPIRGTGWKTAWLLWPKSNTWPRDGEIDFPEGNLTGRISAFMHKQNATSGSDQAAFSTTATYEPWHTAVIEWKPGSCEFFLDGISIGKSTDRVPNTPMHWVIQSETALDGSIPASLATIEIDWLSIWSYVP